MVSVVLLPSTPDRMSFYFEPVIEKDFADNSVFNSYVQESPMALYVVPDKALSSELDAAKESAKQNEQSAGLNIFGVDIVTQ